MASPVLWARMKILCELYESILILEQYFQNYVLRLVTKTADVFIPSGV